MSAGLLALHSISFFFSLWLGLYLIARDPRKRTLLLTGLGLVFYAAAIFLEVIENTGPPLLSRVFSSLPQVFIYLPALMWTGVLIELVPDLAEKKELVRQLWQRLVLPLTLTSVVIQAWIWFPPAVLSVIVVLPLVAAYLWLLVTNPQREAHFPLGLPLLATVFFGLAVGLALPFTWLPRAWVILLIGVDLACLGIGIAIFDAFEEGHRLAEDMLRNFLTALLIALVFSIQVALVVALDSQLTFGLIMLFYSLLTTAVLVPAFSNPLLSLINRLNFLDDSPAAQESTRLRITAGVLDRVNTKINFHHIPNVDFHRLTRKAISYMEDLPRLASSPLTHLPLVSQRLADRGARNDSLERAHELKALLTESIQRLKPPGNEPFGTTDAWRYYNALHFPYVVGLKPSRRYQPTANLADHAAQALEWFRTQVPERTLHNWQTAAAKLVAEDLKDRLNRLDT